MKWNQVCIIFSQKIPSIARPGALVKAAREKGMNAWGENQGQTSNCRILGQNREVYLGTWLVHFKSVSHTFMSRKTCQVLER